MKSGLPKLNPDAVCVKCGESFAIGYIYRHPIDAADCRKLGIELAEGQTGMPEHMLRTCSRCNFKWLEAVLDASDI